MLPLGKVNFLCLFSLFRCLSISRLWEQRQAFLPLRISDIFLLACWWRVRRGSSTTLTRRRFPILSAGALARFSFGWLFSLGTFRAGGSPRCHALSWMRTADPLLGQLYSYLCCVAFSIAWSAWLCINRRDKRVVFRQRKQRKYQSDNFRPPMPQSLRGLPKYVKSY